MFKKKSHTRSPSPSATASSCIKFRVDGYYAWVAVTNGRINYFRPPVATDSLDARLCQMAITNGLLFRMDGSTIFGHQSPHLIMRGGAITNGNTKIERVKIKRAKDQANQNQTDHKRTTIQRAKIKRAKQLTNDCVT